MAEIIKMPRLSDTMEEGNIVGWMMKVGDKVEPGDVLAEVETDKATMELESFHTGTILYIGVKEGPVAVDGIIAVIGKEGEDFKAQLEAEEKATVKKQEPKEESKPEVVAAPIAAAAPAASPAPIVQTSAVSIPENDGRVRASPLAKRLAKENNVDLAHVKGTGDNGRVTKKDIELYLKNPRPIIIGGGSKKKAEKINLAPPAGTVYGDVAVSQMRKVIAKRLGESKFSAPHFYLTVSVDMAAAIATRKSINMVATTRVSFNDMVIKACALALQSHPAVNSSWLGDRIRFNQAINIGVAVAVPDGLLVPVITDANVKSMAAINAEVKALAGKAKSKKLQPAEMQGNTFTISNLGMFGIEEFTAIVNPPDACILAVGGIIAKPVVKDGEVVPGQLMKLTLSCDHRVVDGASGAQFLNTVKQLLENPASLFYTG